MTIRPPLDAALRALRLGFCIMMVGVIAYGSEQVKPPEFSVGRGLYDAPVGLVLSCPTPGASIRYTTNGTWPTATTGTLGSSLAVTSTKVVRAIAYLDGMAPSPVVTHTYIFVDEIAQQRKNAQGSPTMGDTNDLGSYYVGSTEMYYYPSYAYGVSLADVKAGLRAIPSISLAGDPAVLFGDGGATKLGLVQLKTNSVEQRTSFEVLYPDGRPGTQAENGLHLAGAASLGFAKKGFAVEFRGTYGTGRLEFPLIPGSPARRFDELRLSNSWQARERPWFRQWICDLQIGMSGDGQHGIHVHLFINGIYWGLYNCNELAKRGYAEEHLGGQKVDWQSLRGIDALTNVLLPLLGDLTLPAQYDKARTLLNVEQYVDLLLLYMYLNDPNNWGRELRSVRNPKAGIPAQLYVWDPEEARFDTTTDPVPGMSTQNPLFAKFWANPDFRATVADRIRKHLYDNGALTPLKVQAALRARADETALPYYAEVSRWVEIRANPWEQASDRRMGNYFGISLFNSYRGQAHSWAGTRTDKLLASLKADGLYPALAAPTYNQYGGEVAAGFNLQISAGGGTLYYTLDGSDPRLSGTQSGQLNPAALTGASPLGVTLSRTTQVKARVRSGSTWSALTEAVFTVAQDLTTLKVTELMYHPPTIGTGLTAIDGERFEFLELKNTGSSPLELKGLTFTRGLTFRFTQSTVVAPGRFVVLISSPNDFKAKHPGVRFDGVFSGSLDNGGETIELQKPDGTLVFSLAYDDAAPWPLAPDGAGFSLVPKAVNPAGDPNDPALWRSSAHLGGSPGADDPPPPAILPVVISEVLTHTDPPQLDTIELHNPNASPASVGGWYLTDNNQDPLKYRIPFGTSIPAGGYLSFTETQFNAAPGTQGSFALSALGEEAYLFSADPDGVLTGYSHGFKFDAAANGVSFGRYVISTGAVHYPAQKALTLGASNAGPKVGPVVLTELMYNPLGGDEFVELKNITSAAVKLHDPANPQNTWKVSGIDYAFPTGLEIPAQGLLLVVPLDPARFRTKYAVPAGVQILGPYLGKLDNGGEKVSLKRPDSPTVDGAGLPVVPYIVVDEVEYDDGAPWPLEPDGSGPSLERISAPSYANDPINWRKSAASGGTPGRELAPPNQAPALLSAPWANPNPVTLPSATACQVVAADPDSGPTALRYTWSLVSGPGTCVFSPNGTGVSDLSTVAFGTAGSYVLRVTVFDGAASATGDVTVTVLPPSQPPAITTQPTNRTVTAGQTATFAVTASGTAPLFYQWQKNGLPISGAVGASYTTPVTTAADSGSAFRVVVSNSAGSVTSNSALLTVNVPPAITRQPASVMVNVGQPAVFGITASGTSPLAYQWRRNGANISGATAATYTIPATVPTDNGALFSVVVSNSAGSAASGNALLTVASTGNQPPVVLLTAPANGAVYAAPASISVAATASDPDGSIAKVRFYNGTALLAEDLTAPYSFVWANVGTGNYTVTAVAVDNQGLGASSPAVTVQVIPAVNVSVADAWSAEPGTDTGRFDISRSGSTAMPLTVFYGLGGTAANGTDYQALLGSVTIPAGASSASVQVVPLDDTAVEGKENVSLTLSANAAYRPGSTVSGTVSLLDDEMPILSVSVSDWVASEPADVGVYTITRTGRLDVPVTVLYTMSGPATAGLDFTAPSGSVTIPAGQAAGTVVLTPLDDTLGEGKEYAVLSLSANAAYQVGPWNYSYINIGDDEKPEVNLTVSDFLSWEAGPNPGQFTVSCFPAAKGNLTVKYALGGTATNTADYATLSGTVQIAAGQSSATIAVIPVADNVREATETVSATLIWDAAYQVGFSSGTVQLLDYSP